MQPATGPIAVVGATGNQGGATARALLARHLPVRALVHDTGDDAAGVLTGQGATLAQVDLTDGDSARAALEGAASAFVMTTMTGPDGTAGETAMGVTVTDAALDAGLPFVLYSSVGAAERHTGIPHFESKRRVEQHLEGLAIAHSFLRPTFFMDNFTAYFRPRVDGDDIVLTLPLPADIPLQMVAVRDIGRAAAALLADPSAAPPAIEIIGDTLTGAQMADAFAEAFGRPVRYQAVSPDSIGDDDQAAMFTWLAAAKPAYEGDVAGTRALVPDVLDFRGWIADAGVTPATG